MYVKQLLSNLGVATGCAAAWLLVLPILMVGGLAVMSAYVLAGEFVDFVAGRPLASMSGATARATAERVCVQHS